MHNIFKVIAKSDKLNIHIKSLLIGIFGLACFFVPVIVTIIFCVYVGPVSLLYLLGLFFIILAYVLGRTFMDGQ